MCAQLSSSQLSQTLRRSVDGLLYISESDSEFTVHVLDGWNAETPPSEPELLPLLSIAEDTKVEKISFEAFITPLTEPQEGAEEDAKQYATLKDELESQLTDLTVYRIGTVEIAIYILGKAADGVWLYLQTNATETE